MNQELVIYKLSSELNDLINGDNFEIIKKYISYAVVYGLEQRSIFKNRNLLMSNNLGIIVK